MVRFIIGVTAVMLFLILGIPVLLIEWVIGKFNQERKDYHCLRFVQYGFRLVLFICGVKVTILGEENVPKDQAVLYVGNHRSAFDIPITYTRCPRPTGYIAKDEMLKYPLLRDWMKALHCLFLNRDDIKAGLKTILQAIEYVKEGISICVFPEGTRSHTDEMLPFKEGSMKIAEKTGCPIVPMAISGTSAIFEDQFPRIRPRHVVLEYGKPILPGELSKEERKFLGAYTQQRIQEMLNKNASLV